MKTKSLAKRPATKAGQLAKQLNALSGGNLQKAEDLIMEGLKGAERKRQQAGSTLEIEYRRLLAEWQKTPDDKKGIKWDTRNKRFILSGPALKWAEIGARATGKTVDEFFASTLTSFVSGGDGHLAAAVEEISTDNPRGFVEVFTYGQCGRFEILSVSENGFCNLQKGGISRAINLQESVKWYRDIQKEEWWGTWDADEHGLGLWLDLIARHLGGRALASTVRWNQVFHPNQG